MIERSEMLLVAAGPFAGGLAGCIGWRIPRSMNWVSGRSACESCCHVLAAWQLVPILSFLWLGGRCHHCRGKINPAWLAVELAALAVTAGSVWLLPPPAAWSASAGGWLLIFVAILAHQCRSIDNGAYDPPERRKP